MSATTIAFPYERRPSALLGTTQRPVARVECYSTRFRRWIAYTMVVDSGADFCVIPAPMAIDLGLDRQRTQQHTVWGIGGPQRVSWHPRVRLRLGPWEVRVPIGVVERGDLPPLLGRYRCLDVFDLHLSRFVATFARS